MNKHRLLLCLLLLFCTAFLTACQEKHNESFSLPTQLEQLEADLPPTAYEETASVTTMRRENSVLTIEALSDGLSYRLTPELLGQTPPNLLINFQGIDQSGSYIAYPESSSLVLNDDLTAILTLNDDHKDFAELRYLSFYMIYTALPCSATLEIPLDGSERIYTINDYQVKLQSVRRQAGGYALTLTPIAAPDGSSLFFLDITNCLEEDSAISSTLMNDQSMQITLKTTRSRDESVHLIVSHYNLSTGYWLYELPDYSSHP